MTTRRRFLVRLGGGAVATTLVIGAGAVSTIGADRRISVEVEDDDEAYLTLTQLGDGTRSFADGTPETVEFGFPGFEERLDGRGLGVDSIYEFGRDADETGHTDPTEGLLRIENEGTRPVEVYSEHDAESELEIELYDVSDPDKVALRDEPVELAVGDSVDTGFRITTFGARVETFDETLSITARPPSDGD